MLAPTPRPRAVQSVHGAMSSQRAAELSRNQSGGSGPASPASSRSESGSTSLPFCPTRLRQTMDDDSNASSGSRSGSTADSIDFRFLNFTNPADARNAQTRRSVRSHVTTKQHEKQRRAAAAQARRTTDQYAEGSSSSSLRPPMSRSTSIGSPDSETSSPDDSPTSPSPATSLVRLNPLEVYPQDWHPYLRPVMVRESIEQAASDC